MIAVELQYNLEALSRSMQAYGEASGKTENEVLQKQGANLGFNIAAAFKKLKPAKGSIRSQQLERLKAGGGVHVRDVVMRDIAGKYGLLTSLATGKTYFDLKKNGRRGKVIGSASSIVVDGKAMNFQALAVERELNIRESARGFAAWSAPRPASRGGDDLSREIESRYGFILSDYELNLFGSGTKSVTLTWRSSYGDYQSPVAGLSKPKQQSALNEAVAATTADINEYIEERQREDIREFFGLS